VSVVQCLRQIIREQIARSRNAGDTLQRKIQRAFWVSVYTLYGVWVGVTFLRREVLGERVIWRGKRAWVNNWANSQTVSLRWDGGGEEYCGRQEIKTIYTPATFLLRAQSGFRWWATNWLNIAVDQRLYPEAFGNTR